MRERRIFPKEFRDFTIRLTVILAIVIGLFVLLAWMWTGWSEKSIFGTCIFLGFLACLLGINYWSVRHLTSVAEPMTSGKVLYEGRAYDAGTLVVIVVGLLFSFLTLAGPVYSIVRGEFDFLIEHFYLFLAELIFPAIVIVAIVQMFRLSLEVEEEGIVLRRWTFLPSVPPRFFPFRDLEYLVLEGRTLAYGTKYRSVRGKLVVKNPEGLEASLKKTYTAGKRAIRQS